MFVLIHIIVILVLDVVSWAIKMPLGVIYALAVILPSFGLTVRRLHDIGKSGWWCLIGLVPVVGTVVLVVFAVMDSQTGDNQYGPNPKGVPAV